MPAWSGRHGWGWSSEGARPRRIRRFLEPAVLLLLHCNPSHGYGLLDGLSSLGLESYPADVSAVYRVLNDLEEAGMLVSRQDALQSAGPPRRVYALTERGDAYLHEWVRDLRETERVLRRFMEAYDAHQEIHTADGQDAKRAGAQ